MSFSSFIKKTNPINHPKSRIATTKDQLHFVHRERLKKIFKVRNNAQSSDYYLKFIDVNMCMCVLVESEKYPDRFMWHGPISLDTFDEGRPE